MLWALFVCAFVVYKNFTAIDLHIVHGTTVVQQASTDTNAIESFVTNFAKVYYSWEQSAALIDQRTGIMQVSQFVLQLRQDDGNWKMI